MSSGVFSEVGCVNLMLDAGKVESALQRHWTCDIDHVFYSSPDLCVDFCN